MKLQFELEVKKLEMQERLEIDERENKKSWRERKRNDKKG